MQDNSTNDAMELLISYMDGELSPAETAATEKMLREDVALKERFENLLAAKQAIKAQGLKQHIKSLHQQYYTEVQAAETAPAKVIKPAFGFKTFMRIAAVFILVVAGYGVYQYTATNNESLFADNFINYQLPLTRGAEQADDLDALYNANNYMAVIAAVNGKQQKTQKDYFLAAQAYLQTNDATAAIAAFKNVEQLNSTATDKYFVQETDYYLALAYIKEGNIDEAGKQLNKITFNKQHMFYSKASEISSTKLTILKWKQ
jgi:tellurite resistance protein